MIRRVVAFAVGVVVLCSFGVSWAAPPGPPKVAVYSVKFLCGFQSPLNTTGPIEPPVKPGNYATAINIHNFHTFPVTICKKAVLAPCEECLQTGHPCVGQEQCLIDVGKPQLLGLSADFAVEVDCHDIVSLLGPVPLPSFIKGFVEIVVFPQPPLPSVNPLSVTGVYTALGCTQSPPNSGCSALFGTGLDVEPQNSFLGEVPPECQAN